MTQRDHLLTLLNDEDQDALMRWVGEQPLLDQPDILRELKELLLELSDNKEEAEALAAEFDKAVASYEDKILDGKLAEADLPIELAEEETPIEDIDATWTSVRDYVIGCIIGNAENADAMREMAQKMMKLEQQAGTFNEANWRGIL